MSSAKIPSTGLILPATAVVLIGVSWWWWRNQKDEPGSGLEEDDSPRTPPKSHVSMWQTIAAIGGADGPMFLWNQANELHSDVFYLNLPFPLLVVGDAAVQRTILMNSDKPIKLLKGFARTLGGPSIFTMSNSDAIPLRKKVLHGFAKNKVDRIDAVCQQRLEGWMTNRLDMFVETKQPFDPCKEMQDLTFEVICESLFEYHATQEEGVEFIEHGVRTAKEFGLREATNPFRPLLYYLLPDRRKAFESVQCIHAFGAKILENYRQKEEKRPGTIIDIIENEMDLAESEKIPQILLFLFAGHDTTGLSLGTALYHLAKYPAEQDKLRRILLRTPRDQWKQLLSVQNALKESYRTIPTVAITAMRRTDSDVVATTSSNMFKFVIPKGTTCIMSQNLPAHNPSIFPDPFKFRPGRWENASDAMKEAQALLPFYVGPRKCPGQPLAEAELHSVLPDLVSKYEFALVDEGTLENFITYKPVNVRLRAVRVAT